MPSDRELNKLYSGDYEFRVDKTSLFRFEKMATKVIRKFKKLHPAGRTLLDIGAGYGTFVEVAISSGIDAIGIEPARNLYKLASTKVKGKILHSDLKNFIRSNTQKYDFISLIHVIEHVKSPKVFLKTVLTLLKPMGVLYIETPNSDSHLVAIEKESYTFLTPPDHVNLFSEQSMDLLIKEVAKTYVSYFSTYSYPEHLVGIIRIIKQSLTHYHVSSDSSESRIPTSRREKEGNKKLPFFDRVVAPILTPLLNIGNKGSFLQAFVQKKN